MIKPKTLGARVFAEAKGAKVARSVGFEPTTSASAGLRSILLSYERALQVVPKVGFEPTRPQGALRPERSASTVPPLRPHKEFTDPSALWQWAWSVEQG